MMYQAQVKFTFILDGDLDSDSETFEIEASSKDEAFRKSFERVLQNWDKGSIGITSVDIA